MLGIYAFPAIKNINPNQGSTKDYTHPSGQSRGPNGDKVRAWMAVTVDGGDGDDGDGDGGKKNHHRNHCGITVKSLSKLYQESLVNH